MIPGMNPRQMKQAMKRLGIQQDEIDANEVIIRCDDRDIVISNPQVVKVNMAGQKTYQITGEEEERSIETNPELEEDDIQTVMQQAEVSREKAEEAIIQANYDLAEAILFLKNKMLKKQLIERINQRLSNAEFILTKTYPLIKDPKMLLGVLENIYYAINDIITCFLEEKYYDLTDDEKYKIFIIKFSKHVEIVKEIKIVWEKRKRKSGGICEK